MNSKLYVGQVSHKRLTPKVHAFNYSLFMPYLDLDEIEQIKQSLWFFSTNRFNLLSFYRKDHFGDNGETLKESITHYIDEVSGQKWQGKVFLLSHCRFLGFSFNPVSFFYCFSGNQIVPDYIIAEVNNTPWGEKHLYLHRVDPNKGAMQKHHFSNQKAFHVSPFNPMQQSYQWVISNPAEQLHVYIANRQDGKLVFFANLFLHAKPFNAKNLLTLLIQFPFLSLKVVLAIYWQAFKLLLKKTPIYDHPKQENTPRSQL